MQLGDLPYPILLKILDAMEYRSMLSLKSVSKWWFAVISKDKQIWQSKLARDFGRTDDDDVDLEREYDFEWKFRFGQCKVSNLEGHSAGVHVVATCGSTAVSASVDGIVKVWNLETKECVHTLETQGNGPVIELNEEKVAAVNGLGFFYVWDLSTGELVHTWKSPEEPVFHIGLLETCLISGGCGKVRFWDMATGECKKESAVDGGVKHLSVNGGEVLCGSSKGVVSVFDPSGILLYTLKGACYYVHHIHATSNRLDVWQPCGRVEKWNRHTRKQVPMSNGRKLFPKWFSTGAKLWDVTNWSCVRTFELATPQCFFLGDGKCFAGFPSGLVQMHEF